MGYPKGKEPQKLEVDVFAEDGISIVRKTYPHNQNSSHLMRMADGTSVGISHKDKNEGGWERSHHHDTLDEVYAVITGKIWIYEMGDDALVHPIMLGPGDSYTVRCGLPHNIYTIGGTTLSVTKIPITEGSSKDDWHRDEFLDELLPENPAM